MLFKLRLFYAYKWISRAECYEGTTTHQQLNFTNRLKQTTLELSKTPNKS